MTTFFDAFISYGRADSLAFGRKLYARLLEEEFKIWFDQNDIPLGVDFQNQIDDGIEKAHNFLFIIAPHSVNSPYCLKEIELAIKRNKRIIPLLHVEQISWDTWQQRFPNGADEEWEAYKAKGKHTVFQNMHPTIGKINWVYFREGIDDFEKSFAGLIELLKRYADYVEQHTQLLAKALEWERHQKRTSYLLIADEKQQAQDWLKRRFKDEQPPCVPTDLHCEFITESIKNANNLMTQVIISYADEDRATMEKIRSSLRRESITVWTNTTDIQTGEAFEEAIKRGIEQADNVVYLLSPDSVKSYFVRKELDYALSLNKRIIPVLVREISSEPIPNALRDLQYIDLTDNVKEDDYLLDESQLLRILHQDEAYYNEHKVLLTKALKWKRQHENPSILLRGYNLRSAETWLKVAQKRTQHPPIPLQEEFIAESLQQPPASSLDVFVSYSRADADFARKLNDSLQIQGKTTWFDQESIASGSDFQQEIYRGIKACDNFLFILSPRSVSSPYCKDEVEYAAALNKRFVTVLHRDVNSADLHPELAKVQWIDFNQNERDFNANFNQLVRTLDTDREHVHSHTKWLQRAIEWDSKDKSADLLLRGSEFAIAENWLQEAHRENKQPTATPLQKEYITASHEAKLAELKKEQYQAVISRVLGLVSGALLFALLASILAGYQWHRAEIAQAKFMAQSSLSLSDANRQLDALISAIKAGRQLQKRWANDSVVLAALEAAVYGDADRENNRLVGHDYSVNSVSFSPDGQTIATASGDRTVKLWNREGKLIQDLKGHDQGVYSVAWSSDGQTIASASFDNTVRLWNREGKLLQNLKHSDNAYSVSFSPDDQTIATASQDKTAKIWSREGKLLHSLPHQDGVSSVVWSPDGQLIATGSYDGAVKLWNREGKLLPILIRHKAPVHSVSFSPDSQTIATASQDKTVILWNRQGKPLKTLEGHQESVQSVSFSPDGKTIATASRDKTVILWNRDEGIRQLTLKGHQDQVSSVDWSPDGKTIATASTDKTVILWSRQGKQHQTFKEHKLVVTSVSFSPDGQTIATGSSDKTVQLWNRDGTLFHIFKHDAKVNSVSFSPDGQAIAVALNSSTVELWNRQGLLLQTLPLQNAASSVVWSPDGQIIATASYNGDIKLWSHQGKLLQTLRHDDAVYSVSFSPDGQMIASASKDDTARLWSREGELLQTLPHDGNVKSVSFSPDSQTIATASEDQTVKLWSRQGKLFQNLKHNGEIHSVAWSPDGKTIASAGTDKVVKLWNREGKEVLTLKRHNGAVYSISFSPDGKTIASGGQDNTVILWNLEDLRLDKLMQDACDWAGDYLKYNSEVEKSDRTLCDGIGQK